MCGVMARTIIRRRGALQLGRVEIGRLIGVHADVGIFDIAILGFDVFGEEGLHFAALAMGFEPYAST